MAPSLKGVPRAAAKAVVTGSSRVLGDNMKRVGLERLAGEFAHHIVAHGDDRAKDAVKLLKKFHIDVDDAVNGVYLPGYKTSPNPHGKAVHGNLHTNAYYEAVDTVLKGANTQAEVIQRLRFIAHNLEHGILP
ncbi:MAG: AHH domain-containing protein [Polyangiaceae bacterium]|nr:AHH domain-containing protein [Polyangiaceae bacterium]